MEIDALTYTAAWLCNQGRIVCADWICDYAVKSAMEYTFLVAADLLIKSFHECRIYTSGG